MRNIFVSRILIVVLWLAVIGIVKSAVYNAKCSNDKLCQHIYTSEYDCENGNCIRKSFEYNIKQVIGIIVIVLLTTVANAGGLGAGAVIIPVYMFLYDFSATDSIPLSKITIFAGAIVNYVLSWKERYRKKNNKFVINYQFASIIVPLILSGTQVGVSLSKFLPPFVIVAGLVSYLGYSVVKMYQRGKKEWNKEELERMEEFAKDIQGTERENQGRDILENSRNDVSAIEDKAENNNTTDTKTAISESFNIESEDQIPTIVLFRRQWGNIGYMLLSLLVIFATALVRGGEGSKSIFGISQCSMMSNIIFLISQLTNIFISYLAYQKNKSQIDSDDAEGYFQMPADQRKKVFYLAYLTGVGAGSLGIGGGMILGPYLLGAGVCPELSTAISGFIVVFSSSSTSFQFTIAGAIHARHAFVFMFFSFVGSVIGNLTLKSLVKKYKRPSILVWTVFSILLVASFILPAQMMYNSYNNPEHAFSFGKFC